MFNHEAGCVYDLLELLSSYADGKNPADIPDNTHYQAVHEQAALENITVPEHLRPFICKVMDGHSFLKSTLHNDGKTYASYTKDRLLQIVRNRNFLARKYVEFFLPDIKSYNYQSILSGGPKILSLIRQHIIVNELETDFLNSIYNFDYIAQELSEIIERMYHCLYAYEKKSFWDIGINKTVNPKSMNKLYAITKLDRHTPLTVSYSLLAKNVITYYPEDPRHLILGYNYASVLEEQYKYEDATLLSFAKTLNNEVKYDIYTALTQKISMNRSELSEALGYSVQEIGRNIRAMEACGLLKIDKTKTRSREKYYCLNKEYMQFISSLLNLAVT